MWEVTESGNGSTGATMTVNGQTKPVTVGINFKDAVIEAAREYGLGKFRLFLNDEEILPSQAPALVADGMAIRLVPFDVAGGNIQ